VVAAQEFIAVREKSASVHRDSDYYLFSSDSMQVRIGVRQRRIMYRRFIELLDIRPDTTMLDVGVTSDRVHEGSNYLEAWHPHSERITALGLGDASFLCDDHPGVAFVQGNGLFLPFRDGSFDVVHCSAVIEHVGNFRNQMQLVAECARVARRGFFITTPYRWFPIEVHTSLPLLHWLPKSWHRAILSSLGYTYFCSEDNLNLMDKWDLARIAENLVDFAVAIHSVRLYGVESNLLLVGLRRELKSTSEPRGG
jgi:hypothetical protein